MQGPYLHPTRYQIKGLSKLVEQGNVKNKIKSTDNGYGGVHQPRIRVNPDIVAHGIFIKTYASMPGLTQI